MRVTTSLLFAFTIGLGAPSAPPGTTNYTRLDATVAFAGASSIEARYIHIPFSGTDPQTEAVDQSLGLRSAELRAFALQYLKAHGKA